MRWIIFCTGFFALSGCFDADFGLTFADDESVETKVELSLNAGFFDLITSQSSNSGSFCDGGEQELKGENYVCRMTETTSIDELVETGRLPAKSISTGEVDNDMTISVEKLEEGIVRVSLNLSELMENNSAGEQDDASSAQDFDMGPLVTAMAAGHGIRIWYRADEVLETNGEVSEDGKHASIYIPLTALVVEESQLPIPDKFTATLRYAETEKTCFLGFLCF